MNVLPYLVKALPDGLHVCMPQRVVQPAYVLSVYLDNLVLGAGETLTGRRLAGHDLLSATMRWDAAEGSLTAPLVRGMPYASVRYDGLTPRLGTQHAVLSVNGSGASPATGTRFRIALNNGQTWIVYASAPLTLSWNSSGLSATAPFSGWLRAANLPADAGAEAALDSHRDAIPTGGEVDATASGDVATLTFHWTREGAGPLLMSALPHHLDVLQAPVRSAVRHRTVKGWMVGMTGDSWTMAEPLPTLSWSAPRPLRADRVEAVRTALAADLGKTPVAQDTYFYGKQTAAVARLALIADELGEAGSAALLRERLRTSLAPFLEGSKLRHDATWGGVVAAAGLASPQAEFGAGYYNDHHFHYGYLVYAAAVLARADAQWAAAHDHAVRALIRDVANPSNQDGWFPRFRSKDWFEGHSWAAGLFEFADSRNQESSSEAVNAWYAVYLYGLATGDRRLADLGRLLMATEIRTVQRYWQIRSGSEIYESPFADNKVVGVLWSTKVDYATFFGANVEYIHCIQMLPFTPATELLLDPAWIAEEYPVLATALTRPSPALEEEWRGFILMALAILDPAEAWTRVQSLARFDDGNTRTNTLYWIGTRP